MLWASNVKAERWHNEQPAVARVVDEAVIEVGEQLPENTLPQATES